MEEFYKDYRYKPLLDELIAKNKQDEENERRDQPILSRKSKIGIKE